MNYLKNFRFLAIIISVTMIVSPSSLLAQDAGGVAHAPALAPLGDNSLPQALDGGASSGQADGLHDHKAVVFDFKGDVRILKSESENWQPVSKKMIIEEGDQLLTGAESYVDVAYDHFFLNIARVQEKTKAEFRSIEPTDVFMEDGTVFSALDGLDGGAYQISTPTAVAGVRGTTFDVNFNSATGALNMNVYKDLSQHQGVVEVDAGAPEPLVITEGNGWDHETQSIIEVPQERAAQAQNFLDQISDEFGGLREEGLSELNTSEPEAREAVLPLDQEEAGEEKTLDEDSQENVGGPGDGGNNDQGGPLGDEGGAGGNDLLNREASTEPLGSDVDAFVDSLIPPDDVNLTPQATEITTGVSGPQRDEKKTNSNSPTDLAAPKNDSLTPEPRTPDKVDYGKAMEFLSIGGLGTEAFLATGEGSAVTLKDYTTNVMTNLGVGLPAAQLFGTFVEKYTEIGGRMASFVAGPEAHAAVPMSGPMFFGEGGGGGMMGSADKMGGKGGSYGDYPSTTGGYDPNNSYPGSDASDFGRIVTETSFYNNPPAGSNFFNPNETGTSSSTNPYFNGVLHALQMHLSQTLKASLLSGGHGMVSTTFTEIPSISIDGDANTEKVLSVIYINQNDQIHATYEGLKDDDGTMLQPDIAGQIYNIDNIDILACNPSPGPAQSGC